MNNHCKMLIFKDEDIDCSTMDRNFERSSSSSKHSVLARPITLNFSDEDDEFDSNNEDVCSSTIESQQDGSIRISSDEDAPDSSR